MTDVDAWICSQELGFVLKSEQREALELLLRGKDVFCVLRTGFDKSLIYQMFVHAKKKFRVGRNHTTFTSCKNAAWSNELFSLSRVDYALEENVLTEQM